jgi:hypothetical protein
MFCCPLSKAYYSFRVVGTEIEGLEIVSSRLSTGEVVDTYPSRNIAHISLRTCISTMKYPQWIEHADPDVFATIKWLVELDAQSAFATGVYFPLCLRALWLSHLVVWSFL